MMMRRNPALMELAPGQVLWVSEKQLGVVFCSETFTFVLNPRTRRAAERVARWHGCAFQFNQANGSAAFIKRNRVSGFLLSWLESGILACEHALLQARLVVRRTSLGSSLATASRS
jgi:hypothetical protein